MQYEVKCTSYGKIAVTLSKQFVDYDDLNGDKSQVYYTECFFSVEQIRNLISDLQKAIRDSNETIHLKKLKEIESLKARLAQLEDEVNEPTCNRY